MKDRQTIKYTLQAYIIMIIIALLLVSSISVWQPIENKYNTEITRDVELKF